MRPEGMALSLKFLKDKIPPALRMELNIENIDHIVLTVEDMERSVQFYRDVLGLEVEASPVGRYEIRLGRQKINLHQAGWEIIPHALLPRPGSADFCMITQQPIKEIAGALSLKGLEIEHGPVERFGARGPMMSIYIRDPDGNLVEISAYNMDQS